MIHNKYINIKKAPYQNFIFFSFYNLDKQKKIDKNKHLYILKFMFSIYIGFRLRKTHSSYH
jgi:hypothetical protein